jgi:phage-related protein (TIGR01555 family)
MSKITKNMILPEVTEKNSMPDNWYLGDLKKSNGVLRADAKQAIKMDGVANMISSQGTNKSKSYYSYITDPLIFTPIQLGLYYHSCGLLRKLVDIFPDQMVRKWITINGDTNSNLANYLTKLNAQGQLGHAIRWARLYGGAIVMMGINDGRKADEPVDYENIKSIEFLRVIDRSQIFLYPSDYYLDAGDPKFGMPSVYTVRPVLYGMATEATMMYRVHESRCLRFDGDVSPDYMKRLNFGWGAPILQTIYPELMAVLSAYGNIGEIMHEMILKVFSIANLTNLLSTEDGRKIIKSRLDDINLTISAVNGVFMDSSVGETLSRNTIAAGGIEPLVTKLELALCAVCGIPYMVLYGKSPTGLASMGEGEIATWMSSVKQKQEQMLRPQIQRLIGYIILAKDCKFKNDINDLSFEFDSLEDFSEKDLVSMRNTQSSTDAAYISIGALMPEEVRESRFSGGYHFETQVEQYIDESSANKEEAEGVLKQQYEQLPVDNITKVPNQKIVK